MSEPCQVLLIQPMQGEYTRRAIFQPGVEIPLNLTSLAVYLDKFGIANRLLDLRTTSSPRASLREALERGRPRLIGLSAYSSEIAQAMRLAEEVKKVCPGSPIVIGGYHATAEPEETLGKGASFDYLVFGEGEITFLELACRLLEDGAAADLPGLACRQADRVILNPPRPFIPDLDSLPFTHREKLDLSLYLPSPGTGNFLRLPSTGIMASRGCPYNCYYCSKGVWGAGIRFRTVDHVLAEMELCIARHRIRDFRFYDDVLPLPKWDLRGFCGTILERGLDVSWNCYSRVDLVDRELLDLMKRAGCYHIKYGIEFGTADSLRRANKRTTLDQARQAVRMTREAGIECKGNFILGIPGEKEQDCRETVRFAIELSPDLASFYPFYPAPGSVYADRLRSDPEVARGLLPEQERESLAREAYRLFYLRPAFIVQRFSRLARYPSREIRVLASAARMMTSFALRRAATDLATRWRERKTGKGAGCDATARDRRKPGEGPCRDAAV